MSEKNKVWLQVPNEIVRNIGVDVDEKSFAVYAFLLYKKFKSKSNLINIDHNTLKDVLGFKDNRTLKKCFKVIHEQGWIKSPVEKFPINKYLEIELLHPYRDDCLIELPVSLLMRINEIGYVGYRLMYYYESHITRKNVTKDYCHPVYETIISDLKISDKTLTRYNNKLKKEKLITITKHEVQFDNPFDENRFDRYNNRYRVNLFNI